MKKEKLFILLYVFFVFCKGTLILFFSVTTYLSLGLKNIYFFIYSRGFYFLKSRLVAGKDYYDILGLTRSATEEEIKKAYRKLAMQHHPDRNAGDKESETKFKAVNEAYSVLSDSGKRKNYDMFGSEGGPAGFGGFSGDVDLGDVFSSFFGGGFGSASSGRTRKKSSTQRGEDREYTIELDLKTSIYGGKEQIEFKKKIFCSSCNGFGGEGKKTCNKCNGSGYVRYRQESFFGVIEHTGTCDGCSGSGEIIEKVCGVCHGQKRTEEKRVIDIDIPAGIDNGMIIKMTGEGNDGIGVKERGDLYVKFKVKNEEKGLTREGTDLYYEIEINVLDAILGITKEINIPILGKRQIKILSGTQVGTVIKLSSDGVKYIDNDKKGDLYVSLVIKIPKKLTKRERELYEQIANSDDEVKGKEDSLLGKLFS